MLTVAEILKSKPMVDVCTIAPDATVFEAIRVFAERNLGALIVLEGGRVVGVVTERDYARKVILRGRSSHDSKVRDIMSSRVVYVTSTTKIDECMALMTDRFIRHLPVIDDGRLAGIVSIGDVVKAVIRDHEFMVDELVRYITDSPVTTRVKSQEVSAAVQAPTPPFVAPVARAAPSSPLA